MASKFHLKEDGMPGRCSASIRDCPRTANSHGTEAEMMAVSQRLFAEEYEVVVTLRKSPERKLRNLQSKRMILQKQKQSPRNAPWTETLRREAPPIMQSTKR